MREGLFATEYTDLHRKFCGNLCILWQKNCNGGHFLPPNKSRDPMITAQLLIINY
ncbi:MAG: hypothetical protein JWQ30_1761 [Sediminibacterium sp.]|nr:hypothetical protein [Sediminibacterium sp.]